jgi:hypothetical protein
MKTFSSEFQHLPQPWIAFGLGCFLFFLIRWVPWMDWQAPLSDSSAMDQLVVQQMLRESGERLVSPDGDPQTVGAHLLPQWARWAISYLVGDATRAGIWLSVVGVIAAMGGMVALGKCIFPLREFRFLVLGGWAGVGALHYAVGADPSVALGMALLVWGVVWQLVGLQRGAGGFYFLGASCLGLAGYIRLELVLLQCAVSLFLLLAWMAPGFFKLSRREREALPALALGGLLMVALVLWPLVNLNMQRAGVAFLPGPDAHRVLGAVQPPSGSGFSLTRPVLNALGSGALYPWGAGVFAWLLLPIGLAVHLLSCRSRFLSGYWVCLACFGILFLAGASEVTGEESLQESMTIFTSVLFPFTALPLAMLVFRAFQGSGRNPMQGWAIWAMAGGVMLILMQLPHGVRALMRPGGEGETLGVPTWMGHFRSIEPVWMREPLLTDQPVHFLRAGKQWVYGWGGETDWEVWTTRYADASIAPGPFCDYLAYRGIGLIHVSSLDHQEQVERFRQWLASSRKEDQPISGLDLISDRLPAPHSLYRVRYRTDEDV